MVKLRILFFFCLIFSSLFAVENSIVPLIEKYEEAGNLPLHKFSLNQQREIVDVLKCKKEKVRFVSYNMLFDLHDDQLSECNRWSKRLPRIVELVDEMQPDVMGTQELYNGQMKGLLSHIGIYYEFYGKPCCDGEMNGIFFKKSRFVLLEGKVWYMKIASENDCDTLTMVHLKDRKTGKEFAVFNTHLAFSKVNKREAQARFIANEIKPIIDKMPVIFMGDLNTFPCRFNLEKLPFYDGNYIHRILTSASLNEATELSVLGHLGPIATFTNASDDGVPFTGLGEPGVFLDHFYVSSKVKVLIHAVQPGKVEGYFPSDHMPIIMDALIL